MDKITLNTAHPDRAGQFRDAGSVLTVGDDADLLPAKADELVACGAASLNPAPAKAKPVEAKD